MDNKSTALHNLHMDDIALLQGQKWGEKTDLKSFFETMEEKQSPDVAASIRSVVVEISTNGNASATILDNQE